MHSPYRIVIVDDQEVMRQMLQDFLKSLGYCVASFPSPVQALDWLKGQQHWPLIISDIRMTPFSGMELLRLAKETNPHSRVVLITAFGCDAEKLEAIRNGAVGYIQKPFRLSELIHYLN